MFVKSILAFNLCFSLCFGADPVPHDYFTGKPATDEQLEFYKENDLIDTCTINVKPCNRNEWKRVDGTCNNLKNPARGTYTVPQARILPAQYYDGFRPRKAVSGNDLTLPRVVRLYLLKTGKSRHQKFNQNVPGYAVFYFGDIGSPHDIQNTLFEYTVCCLEEHLNDDKCAPNMLQEDDPVHRFSGIRCMNSTKPLTYQDFNCTDEPVPSPIAKATSVFDLSPIYNYANEGDKAVRSYVGGRLTVEEEDGVTFPPNGPADVCPNNQPNLGETRCFKNHINGLLSVSLFNVWFLRNHNFYADKLAEINPCWNDEKLFFHARELNIAHSLQIHIYEWMAELIGRKNLIKAGVIKENGGFRDIYDPTKYPEVTLEYTFSLRWFHLMQESTAKFYDENGIYLKDYPSFNLTFRPGFLAKDNNMVYATQGSYRVPCHDTDYSIDYEIADNGMPNLQRAMDVTTGDLNKCRHFGLAPYIDYVYHFTGKNITCFEDLLFLMKPEKIAIMKEVYEDVADIDLIAGLWAENLMKGGHIPYILACIFNDNMLRAIKGDRHWYERPNRPHAFTSAQLKEVRKMTLGTLLCNVGDAVTEVPKKAFQNPSPTNPMTKCEDLPQIDFSAWVDRSCWLRS